MPEEILTEIREGYAKVILNRPAALNALRPSLMAKLESVLNSLDKNDHVHAVFLMGAGEHFCAGVDLKYVRTKLSADAQQLKRDLVPWGPVIGDLIECMGKPVIAAVHGRAITGGLILAEWCDLILADETAVFGDTHAKWGFVPGWQEPQRVARSVGIRQAKQLFLTGDTITALEAKAMGLVWKVVPAGMLEATIEAWGRNYRKMSLTSLGMMKAQLRTMLRHGWQDFLDRDDHLRQDLVGGFCTPEAADRLKLFRSNKH